jgi:serine/threonine-protein kinase RsbW
MSGRTGVEQTVHSGLEFAPGTAPVEIQIAATPIWFPLMRSVIDHVSRRAALDPDAAQDLRLAVDEACGVLIGLTPDLRKLRCTARVRPHTVEVDLTADLPRGTGTGSTETLAWRLLRNLTDTLSVRHLPVPGNHSRRIQIQLSKHPSRPTLPRPRTPLRPKVHNGVTR